MINNLFRNKKTKPCSRKRNPPTGFTLLVSSLIASLMLVVGLAIFNISFKELQLTTTSRDSQLAFYAADTGMDCVLFWDIDRGGFSDSVFATSTFSSVPGSGVNCVGDDIASAPGTLWSIARAADAATTTFSLDLGESCVIVTVAKFGNPSRTRIESRGQTFCGTESNRRVERALRAKY